METKTLVQMARAPKKSDFKPADDVELKSLLWFESICGFSFRRDDSESDTESLRLPSARQPVAKPRVAPRPEGASRSARRPPDKA